MTSVDSLQPSAPPRRKRLWEGLRRWEFWVRAVVFALGFQILNSITHNTAVQATDLQIFLWIAGAIGAYVGLLVQYFRPEVGLAMTAGFMFVLSSSALFVWPLGLFVVCGETYFIAVHMRARRRLWLGILIAGSYFHSFVYFYYNFFIKDTGRLGEPAMDSRPVDGRFFLSMAGLFAAVSFVIVGSIAVTWWLGTRSYRKKVHVENLAARAELATVSERNRIAREMHDVVAHSLSGIIAQADGGRYAAQRDPQRAVEALNVISTSGREALSQMRGLLSALHDGDESRARQKVPGLSALPDLISDAQRNGIDVSLHGEDSVPELDDARGLTVYRIVQECLTNILKHAGSVEAQVVLHDHEGTLTVAVDNRPGDNNIGGSGRGLGGIRDRAKIYGGTATWGKSTVYSGGWNVTATVPLDSSAR